MSEPRITLVLSDLHLGGGPTDPGDDHIHHGAPLARLIAEQAATPEGRAGAVELFFNGDFLEFAQVNTRAFAHASDQFWCTEDESLGKLETILAGHGNIFAALRDFQAAGNRVTIAAGNHDVDIAWPRVQARLREVAGGATRFEIGQDWITRHGGRLQIGHGHQQDVANRFEHWADPIRPGKGGKPQLEMCPGTLFMVKFVNRLEARYPFADNLLPVTKLLPVLAREDKGGLASVAWLGLKLAATTSLSTLGADGAPDLAAALLQRVRDEPAYRAEIGAALAAAGHAALAQRWQAGPWKQALLAETMEALLDQLDEAGWDRLFAPPPGVTLSANGEPGAVDGVTLGALRKAAFEDGKALLRKTARERAAETGAPVVVMGHTHQADEVHEGALHYFNPGSWTRYLELAKGQNVRMADLRDESRFPYALNYVRVEAAGDGTLAARLVCFERSAPAAG
jgi:UDP-2,3-diacylglucosamine pyrophosphatase LpxH